MWWGGFARDFVRPGSARADTRFGEDTRLVRAGIRFGEGSLAGGIHFGLVGIRFELVGIHFGAGSRFAVGTRFGRGRGDIRFGLAVGIRFGVGSPRGDSRFGLGGIRFGRGDTRFGVGSLRGDSPVARRPAAGSTLGRLAVGRQRAVRLQDCQESDYIFSVPWERSPANR